MKLFRAFPSMFLNLEGSRVLHTIYCILQMQYDPISVWSWTLIVSTFRRLDKLAVMWSRHFLLQLGQYIFHGKPLLPICKKTKFLWFNLFQLQIHKSKEFIIKFVTWTNDRSIGLGMKTYICVLGKLVPEYKGWPVKIHNNIDNYKKEMIWRKIGRGSKCQSTQLLPNPSQPFAPILPKQ